MSRRRIESGLSGQSSFSLRTFSTGDTATLAVASSNATTAHLATPPAIPQQTALSFKFNSLGSNDASANAPAAVVVAAAPPNRALPSVFCKAVDANGAHGNAESMRLTAVIDDLTQRLRKATDAKTHLEGQVQRLNNAIARERATAQQGMQALKTEVSAVQESEMRLRTELASRPAVRELDTQHKFATRVRSALEQEETNAKLADAEARLGAAVKRHDSLAAEVKLLEGRKAEALDSQASVALSAEEVDELVAKAAAAEASLRMATDREAGVKDDIAKFEAMRDAHHTEMKQAESTLLKANQETAIAAADEAAVKQQLVNAKQQHAEMEAQLKQLSKEIQGLSTAIAAPATFSVTGASAPPHNSAVYASDMAKVVAASSNARGIAYHFAHDAPLNVTSLAPGSSCDSSTEAMINALITDLNDSFETSVAVHAKIGRRAEGAVGAAGEESGEAEA